MVSQANLAVSRETVPARDRSDTDESISMSYLLPTDHAFASGPVFPRPGSLDEAIAMTGSEAHGELLNRIWSQFDTGAEVENGVRLGLGARLINLGQRGRISIGAETVIRGVLRNEASGSLQIGRMVYIGDDVIISVADHVIIGHATMLAHGVQVFDNDTHPMDAHQREEHLAQILGRPARTPIIVKAEPVRIGQRCWIGMGAIIMKGATIGDETVVGAGSVVTSGLKAGVIAAGNPATIVRTLT